MTDDEMIAALRNLLAALDAAKPIAMRQDKHEALDRLHKTRLITHLINDVERSSDALYQLVRDRVLA